MEPGLISFNFAVRTFGYIWTVCIARERVEASRSFLSNDQRISRLRHDGTSTEALVGTEDFEKRENELFGNNGFERMVDKVAGIERKLGIYDVAHHAEDLTEDLYVAFS